MGTKVFHGITIPDPEPSGVGGALVIDALKVCAAGIFDAAGTNLILFEDNAGVIRQKVGYDDDFVFGSPQLADDAVVGHDARFWFDKSKAAFRAGSVADAQWDDVNVGDYSAVGGGQNNTASGDYATVGGGDSNTADSPSSTVGGGSTNAASSLCSTVSGGYTNTASGSYTTVGGGNTNTASGAVSTVSGGRSNTASGSYATIGGGDTNTISATSPHGFIGGGESNEIVAGAAHGVIGGGYDNTINHADADFATIGGGGSNIVTGSYGTIGGGYSNTAGSGYSTISGGYDNTADGNCSAIGGGEANIASGYCSTVSGGYGNTANNGSATVGGGRSNTASGEISTISGGYANTASGHYSTIVGGASALADKYGQVAHAAKGFAEPGDAQTSVFVLRKTTTDENAADLALDGATTKLTVPTDTAWAVKILVVAASRAMPCSAMWALEGLIVNEGDVVEYSGPGATAPDQSIDNDAGAIDPTGWRVTPAHDDANDALKITVLGNQAGVTIRWVARVEVVEVGHPAP